MKIDAGELVAFLGSQQEMFGEGYGYDEVINDIEVFEERTKESACLSKSKAGLIDKYEAVKTILEFVDVDCLGRSGDEAFYGYNMGLNRAAIIIMDMEPEQEN